MSIEAIKLAAEFNRYFTSANGVDVPAKVSVSRDEWRALFTAIQQAERPAKPPNSKPVAAPLERPVRPGGRCQGLTKPQADPQGWAL